MNERAHISRREFLNLAAGAAALAGTGAAAPDARAQAQTERKPPARRPNFIFILTDDQGWGDARFQGHPYVKTPALDRLAREGLFIKQFYVCSGVCSPSRCAFMTSHFPARHHIHGHFASPEQNKQRHMPNFLDPKTPTVTSILKQAGYATGHFGKWHLGGGAGSPTPTAYGIDDERTAVSSGQQLREDAPRLMQEAPKGQPHFMAVATTLMVNETIRFIKANKDKPFYVNLWTLLPHAPLRPTPEQLAVYDGLEAKADHDAWKPWTSKYMANAKNLPQQMKVFLAALTDLDTQIARLLDTLDELGLAENTVIVFSSDNGPEDYHIGNAANAGVGSPGPLRGRKRSLYEGGVRTLGLVRWPGRVPAGKVDATSVVSSVDLLPTVCKLAGVDVPADVNCDGEDVSDILLGRPRERTKPIHWEWLFRIFNEEPYQSPQLAVRDGKWKLLLNPDRSRVELYDIPTDPSETKNLAAEHPDVVDRLAAKAVAWQKSLPPSPMRDKPEPVRPPGRPKAGKKGAKKVE